MASSSSSSSSSSKHRRSYDVFLSFRGTDVRNYFLGHLYTALVQSGINTYMDSEDLKKGEQISPALKEAIEESQIAIVVFSKDYASSPWCLEEVAKIMECKEQRGLMVFPVFYKVEPREVRGQRQGYAEAMAKHEVKFGEDSEKVKRWKKALLDAGSLSGWHFMDGYEAGLIQDIVQEISTQLDRTPLKVAKYPVGIDSRVQDLQTILNLQSKDDILMVGLWGQGGIGKTTLAKAIYNAIFREFQGSSFLECVSENSKSFTNLVHLQKKLLSQVLRKELIVFSVDEGSQLIQDRLSNKKVLIILDDVDDKHQLNALAGDCEWFGKGSRIIITTRNKHLLTSHGVYLVKLYKVTALKCGEDLELFRKHAFLRSQKIEIKSNLVDSVLHYAKGLPLALEVLGSFLCGRGEHQWESTLKKLAKSPHKEINDVLKVSYDGLEDYVKEIFLDIACFFKGQKTKYIREVLDSCDFATTIGVEILIERSLISEEDGTLQMHDLIKWMGMEIVKQECCDDAGKRSRLWLYDDVLDVLSGDAGTDAIKAIVLKLPEFEETYICPNAFTNMRKLRLLILHNVGNSFQGPVHLPSQLGCLELHNCALIPEFGYGRKRLVRLDMPNSKIKELPKFKDFETLKFINFSECQSLVCTPDLSYIPNLEELNCYMCKNLERVHASIANDCKLRELNLEGCHLLEVEFLENLSCPRLFILKLSGNNFTTLPTLERLNDLEELEVSNCQQLQEIPKIPGKLRRLEANNCKSLTRIPSNICDVGDVELYSSRDQELVRNGFPVNDLFMPEKFHCQPNHRVVLPGGEMPKWLLPNKEGYISFVASKDLYEKILGVAFCVVFQVLYRSRESTEFEVIGSVNCKAAIHNRRFKFFDLDNVWLEYMELKDLWTVDHFGPNDLTHFHISIRVCNYHELLVKKCGFRLICKPLENDSEVLLQDDQLLDPALFYEVSHEDNPMSTKEKGLNMVDSSIERHRYSSLWRYYGNVSPGREMPKGFVLVEDNIISFKASQDLYNKFVGFFLCVVFDVEDGENEVSFDIVPHVNGQKRNEVSGTLGSFDTDHVWFQFFRTNALWGLLEGAVDFGQFDKSYPIFSLNVRVAGATVKKLGYVLQSNPLEDALKVEIEKNCFMDPASLFENREDPQYAWRRWQMEGFITDLSLLEVMPEEVRVKDEAKEPVVHVGNSYRESPHVAIEYLVGIDKQVEDMMDLLDLEVSDIRIVGIWGKSGVGKTTLARIIYKQISSRFDSCSFLADIETTTKQFGGVQFLQSKLLSDILKQEHEVDHVAKGVDFFKEVLRNMKVLIVLDDVEVQSHLCKIIGEKLDWFGYGSRIIVTTSDMSILPKFIPRGLALVYKINMMNNDQALELFRKHALRRSPPVPGFDEAAKDIINSVNGIPLLIEVIGSLLDRNLVEKFITREEPILPFDLRIQEILQVSYEELSEVQREMLLDIACLPADVDCRIASFMWHNPHFPPSDGVEALRVKSLVKIGRNNELGMHRLLRDHLDPGRRGRLCNLSWNIEKMEGTEHLNFVAEDFKSMPNIRFLILDRANVDGDFANVFPNLKWLQWQGCTRDFKATNFHVEKLVILDLSWSKVTEDWGGWREIKMPHLKVLNLTGCADLLISPDLSSFLDLEMLILERCSQLMKLDTSIRHLQCLTSLNLRFCNELNMLPIELRHLRALKELLIDGTSVQEIPVSVVHMKQLEIFSASNCLQLSHLPDSLCGLTALSVLLLENAKITRIPVSVGKLGKLQHLSLKDCRWIERLPDSIRNLECIERLDITGTGISKLPNSITCFRQLKVLKMDYCFIRELPKEIRNLANLEELHASYCKSLKGAIPTAIKNLDHLRILKLGHSSISGLPSQIISLSCLQTLDLLQCNKIQALPELPTSLTCLRVSSERMKALPDLKGLVKLEEICLGDKDPKELICASTWKKPKARLRDPLFVSIGLPKMKILELSHSKIINLSFTHGPLSCRHLKKLVLSGVNFREVSELPSSLSVLSIQRCFSLKGLPAVGNLRALSELNLIQSAVEEIEGLEGLIALEFLNISYCEIRNLSGLGQLRALRSLILSDCDSLDKLPDISSLKMLNVLEVQRCGEIRDIEGLMELTSLEVLHVSECKAENTQEVQDALKLVMARSLNS